MDPISWVDKPFFSKDRIVLTEQQLNIPGIRMFGKHTMRIAVPPLPNHYHENCFEFTYISKGTITFSIGETDYRLCGGDVFLTRPGEIHSTNLSPISVGEIYWFQLDITKLSELLFLSPEGGLALIQKLSQITHHRVKTDTREMACYMDRFFRLAMTRKNSYCGASYLTLFLHRLTEFAQESRIELSPDIEQALSHISANLTDELPLESLAENCHLSVSQFKQKFKSQVGVPPRNYINFHKIELAKKMLLNKKSITRTAMDLSFNSSSYFAVVFKRYAACTPSEYLEGKAEASSESTL